MHLSLLLFQPLITDLVSFLLLRHILYGKEVNLKYINIIKKEEEIMNLFQILEKISVGSLVIQQESNAMYHI